MTSSHRAYALPLVLVLILVLSATLSTAMLAVNASQFVSESAVHRRQAFHNAEGVGVAVTELASSKLRTLPMQPPLPTTHPDYETTLKQMLADQTADTNTFITENSATFQTPAFTVERAAIGGLSPAELRVLGSGPFTGMQAQVQSFDVEVIVRRDHDRSPGRQSVIARVERATISMFQFYVFADGYLDLDPGGVVTTSGRIHANGDFCIAGEPIIQTVTSAGRILHSNHASGHRLCRRRSEAARGANGIVVTLPSGSRELPTNFDHTDSNWKNRALADYEGQLRDSAHNVIALRMPLSGHPRVQAGANVLSMEPGIGGDESRLIPIPQAKEDNTTSMRFLVDPMLKSEPDDVRRQKLAFKADIRIIDGVWFLRDEAAPETPGKPIWSDHPGSGNTAIDDSGEAETIAGTIISDSTSVGQENLRGALGWGATTPAHFSYYGFNTTGSTSTWARASHLPAADLPRAVISYGLLHNTGSANSVWVAGRYPAATPAPTQPATTLQHFLDGARNGIKDGWLEVRSEERGGIDSNGTSDAERERSRFLPINFDIAAFSGAIQNCSSGELGSYFPGTCIGGTGRAFNGIVFVTSTWPGQMHGLDDDADDSGFAVLPPFQPGHGAQNPVLPSSMCTASVTTIDGATAPTTLCTNTSRANGAFPSVLRVFNGATVSPPTSKTYAGISIRANLYPRGLTIATNLPIIAQGNINTETTPHDSPTIVTPSDHFVPVLLAGDRFHRYSVNWQDHLANWSDSMSVHASSRIGMQTTQYIEILAGWNATPVAPHGGHDHSSDGFEDFPRYNERWSEKAIFRGAIVVAFSSVFERAGANNAVGHPDAPQHLPVFPGRNEGFDHHLQDPINQPPGAPLIVAQSVGFWQAR